MENREKYIEWLADNTKKWAEATVGKYESAVRITSDEMLKKEVISKSLFKMTRSELDDAIFLVLRDDGFLNKDKTGNKMYSNGLKQYRTFIASLCEESKIDEYEITIESRIISDVSLLETERKSIVAARTGQGMFRSQLIDKYSKCVVTGVDNPKLLIASHIKPWSMSNNIERVSVNNGLLLTPTFDKLFDYGLITFTEKGKLMVSSFVGRENEKRLHIPINETFDLQCNGNMLANLQYHNDVLFVR